MKTTSPVFNRNNQVGGTINNIRGCKRQGPGDKKSVPQTGRNLFYLMFSTHSMKYVGIQLRKASMLSIFVRRSFVRPVFGQVLVLVIFDFKCSLFKDFDFLLQL